MKKIAILLIITSSFVFAQNTNVPDDKFEQALIDLGYDDTLDDYVLTANISGVTTLDVSNKEISDLTGIEAFTALTYLDCNHNKLTSLDVSANTALTFLHCYSNQLTSLDVSANTALTNLHCGSNQLTSLDVSLNTALTYLNVERMSMASLDVSNNTALTQLYCSKNQITSLDVSNNTALTELIIHDNQLTSLDVSANTALTFLNVNYNKLTSLDVSKNTALKFFKCADNQLTSLDVSKNTALETLDCYVNQLTSLDVSSNTALTKLDCNSNQLTSLDVSSNTKLTVLQCSYNNQLTNLNMRNGITDQLTTFNATKSGTTLTCIEVLDPAWVTANWTSANGNIEEGVTFSVICGETDLTTWHVATTGSDGSGSGTLAVPLATIQTGINAASDGDTVSVSAGTYVENVFLENPDGGVRKNISVIGENRNTTIIDGNQNGSVFHIMRNGSLFLKNFTIQNGTGHESAGGGIKVSGGPAVLDSLIVKNNVGDGGGIWALGSLTLKNSIIKSNSGANGGAIRIQGDEDDDSGTTYKNIVINNTIFDGNTSENQGGALWISYKNVDISESIFKNNSSSEKGTVYLAHSTVTVKKSILINNTSGGNDGAIRAASSGIKIYSSLIANNKGGGLVFGSGDSTAFLQNVTVVNNSNDAGIYANTKVRILNSIVRGNQSVQLHVNAEDLFVAYSDIEGGLEGVKVTVSGTVDWNTGNIDKNPEFVKVITTGDEESDYHLTDRSPAIGVGTTNSSFVSTSGSITFSTSETSDIEDNPRPNPAGSNPDMGAFENKNDSPLLDGTSSFNDKGTKAIVFNLELPTHSLPDTNIAIAFWKSGAENHECTGCNGRDTVRMSKISDQHWQVRTALDTILVANGEEGESQYWYHYVKTIPDYKIKEDLERFKSEPNPDGLRLLEPGWHKQSSLSNKDTVIAWNNIAPVNFDWVSTASDTINISQSNLTDTYELKWSESKDVDIDTIDYLLYAQIGVYPAEEVFDTTSTSVQITYEEFLENIFEPFPMLPGATVRFSLLASDGKDTVKVTGDDRVLFVNRYDYLSIAAEGVPLEFALHDNYPNPFNPTTTLRFDLPEVSDITLIIYNMLGQKVRTFDYQNTSAGYHSVTWDATNDLGQQVGAGVYLYQLQTKNFVKTRKMVLLK